MISIFDLFKIGIGPSSSHTVGPMLAANMFVSSLEKDGVLAQITDVKCELFGSLGATGRGHASDSAVILGLMGETPENTDTDLVEAKVSEVRRTNKLNLNKTKLVNFTNDSLVLHQIKSLSYHPNAMTIKAFVDKKLINESTYYSVGGGFVLTDEEITNQNEALEKSVSVPYPFKSAKELLQICKEKNMSISQVVLANEKTFLAEDEVYKKLSDIWDVMKLSVKKGCEKEGTLPGGLNVKRRAANLYKQLEKEKDSTVEHLALYEMDWVNLYALAVNEENAAGGRVVTAPTNGAAGIIPATMHFYRDFSSQYDKNKIYDFLLTAGAIGIVIKDSASISGAEVGCQGEIGSACAMAAAGLTEVLGGTPEQCTNAAEIGLEHNLGLTCDPIAGLVQIPCIERNAMGAVKAINASRLARRGDGQHFVSLDKAIKTMAETGKDMMDKYKETARGGLATNVIDVAVNVIEC